MAELVSRRRRGPVGSEFDETEPPKEENLPILTTEEQREIVKNLERENAIVVRKYRAIIAIVCVSLGLLKFVTILLFQGSAKPYTRLSTPAYLCVLLDLLSAIAFCSSAGCVAFQTGNAESASVHKKSLMVTVVCIVVNASVLLAHKDMDDLTGVLWFVGANVLVLGSALYFDHLISSTSAELGKLQDHMYILKSV